MDEFNVWDFWDYDNVIVKVKGKEEKKARIICVDEGDDSGETAISFENKEGIFAALENEIEYIKSEEKKELFTYHEEGNTWLKTIIS